MRLRIIQLSAEVASLKSEIESIKRRGTCSAEDLVVLKAFASRPQDWIDIEKIIIRQSHNLDRHLIRTEPTPLIELKDEPGILIRLEGLFQKHSGDLT